MNVLGPRYMWLGEGRTIRFLHVCECGECVLGVARPNHKKLDAIMGYLGPDLMLDRPDEKFMRLLFLYVIVLCTQNRF